MGGKQAGNGKTKQGVERQNNYSSKESNEKPLLSPANKFAFGDTTWRGLTVFLLFFSVLMCVCGVSCACVHARVCGNGPKAAKKK